MKQGENTMYDIPLNDEIEEGLEMKTFDLEKNTRDLEHLKTSSRINNTMIFFGVSVLGFAGTMIYIFKKFV